MDAKHGRVVELVSENDALVLAQRAVAKKTSAAITEMKLALGETRFEPQKASHLMANSGRVLKPRAKRHIASALAVDRDAARGGFPEPLVEASASRKRARVKLGIASGQPDRVSRCIRRLVLQRRKWLNFRACLPPSLEDVRVCEREGMILGERDSLAGRRHRRLPGRLHGSAV